MKQFITAGILFIAFQGYSQTSVKTQAYNAASLNQYMWSFSKNMPKAGEKALIDFDVIDNWRQLGNYLSVSDDSRYFAYSINKMVYTTTKVGVFKLDSLIVQSSKGDGLRIALPSINPGFFTDDSKQYIFRDGSTLHFLQLGINKSKEVKEVSSFKVNAKKSWLAYLAIGRDSLILQDLRSGNIIYIAGVTNYDFSANGDWLIGQKNDKELLLRDLTNGKEKRFSSVEAYAFSENGKALLINSVDQNAVCLQYVSLPLVETKTIWCSAKGTVGNYGLDGLGKQVVFTVLDSANAANTGIWYYKIGMQNAVLKMSHQISDIPFDFEFGSVSFTDNGRYLNVDLNTRLEGTRKVNPQLAQLEVWNHKDLKLQSNQAGLVNRQSGYRGIVNVQNGKLVFLENNDKKLWQQQGDFAIVKKDYQDLVGDRFWEKTTSVNSDSIWMVDLRNGSNHLLPTTSSNLWFSPDGKYLVYFDNRKSCHYFSFNLNTKGVKDITANVPEAQLSVTSRQETSLQQVGCLAAWIKETSSILIYDNYDIWKLDISGRQPPVNITNGFGRLNSIIFSLFATGRLDGNALPVIHSDESLMLRAYNIQNKRSGFYSKAGLKAKDPKSVFMGEYFINAWDDIHDPNISNGNRGLPPMRAQKANSWIVQRQSTNDAPNYYETSDFKNYKRLTNYQPQKCYQWLKEELHSFKFLNGETGQGILYKPENFDPNKKYPVLIVFYGEFSNNLYRFHTPKGNLNAITPGESPIWLLNNGYLVFTPDIHVTPQKYGPSAFNVIEGAANYLNQLAYVDAGKLGGAAHSWSSRLASYVFPHSTSFAATTISGCAVYNPIGAALSNNWFSRIENEIGDLWENQNAWLDATVVLQADKATCAFLLLENKESEPNEQDQALQFFTALWRLNKNAWWLKYDKGDHNLSNPIEVRDYTIRYTQFFDHYLKNAPAPLWMTEGVPYRLKGIESQYELDPQGKCNSTNGEHCLICDAWNKQYKRTPEMFNKEIKEWVLEKDIAEELERKQNEKRKELDKEGEIRTKEVMKMLNSK